MWATLIEADSWHGEIWNRRKNGEAYPRGSRSASSRTNAAGPPTTRASSNGRHDAQAGRGVPAPSSHARSLDDLPNRELFRDRLTQVLSLAHREKRMAAVLLLDLDHFKPVNDSLQATRPATEWLSRRGARLLACLRDCDTACPGLAG